LQISPKIELLPRPGCECDRRCSDWRDAADFNAVLGFQTFDACIVSSPFQIVQIQFSGDGKESFLDELGSPFVTWALFALEDFVDYFTMIIHESDFPLLHRCLLDQTRKWAYLYLDLISWLIVPLDHGGQDERKP
jgi:hypothetical protein